MDHFKASQAPVVFQPQSQLPEEVIDRDWKSGFLEFQEYGGEIVILETGMRGRNVPEPILDGGTVICPGYDCDIVKPGQASGPSPSDLRLGAFPGLTGIRGKQDFEA